ncbi:MAG TPA: conjugative transfer signal peptidase TraF [Rhizomicrobium sp.]
MTRHALLGVAGFAAFAACMEPRATPWLVWNATPSAPVGLYTVMPKQHYERGALVLVHTPASVRTLAAERRYIPANVPLVKRIAAAAGDKICAQGEVISINGHAVANRLHVDRRGRRLPAWLGCLALGPNNVFLLMKDVPDSFDGRYFGAVPTSSIIGRMSPLWMR